VGGLLEFSLQIPSAPKALLIDSMTLHLIQSCELREPDNTNRSQFLPSQKCQIFRFHRGNAKAQVSVSGGAPKAYSPYRPPFAAVARGESFSISHTARMPDHHLARSTTLRATKSVISISHSIELEITFRNAEQDWPPKVFKVTRPITISSVSRHCVL
jgi:hypothetical protein